MYSVQFRNVETGEWEEEYFKESYPAACSLLKVKSRGRAGRIIDTSNGAERDTVEGDMGAYDKFD